MKKKAILYLRFSDPKQAGNTSIATQEKICRNACEVEDFEVVDVIKNEAVSASKTNTERVAELLEFVKENKNKFDVLMVFKLDRFARSQEQHHWLRGQLLNMGIILRSATEKIDESPSGKLVEGVLAAVNEYDNEVKRERVKIAMWARVEQGLYPWQPPLGYKPDKVPGVKLSPRISDESCHKDVKKIFKKYASGLYSKAELAKEYKNKRIKNYNGRTIKFSIQTLHNMLNNVFYTGYLKHKDGRLIKGKHEALISYSLFQKVQEVQSKHSNNANHKYLKNNPDFPLRRFTSCLECKKPLTACWSTSSNGKKYPYYYCKNKKCAEYSKMIKKSTLENTFMDYLANIKPTQKFIKRFNKKFVKRYKERESEIRGEYLQKMEEIQDLEDQIDWIVTRGRKGTLPERVVEKQVEELDQKITLLKSELTDNHERDLDVKALLSFAKNFINSLEYNWFDASPKIKRRLQKLIFPEGVHYNSSGFSNTSLCRSFEIINGVASSNSKDVTPPGVEPGFPG